MGQCRSLAYVQCNPPNATIESTWGGGGGGGGGDKKVVPQHGLELATFSKAQTAMPQ